jgi:ubiquinone/menaquinone biosynthesis C-methylase UbiE
MRKDYIEVSDLDKDETSFVEEYWTRVWDRQGGIESVTRKIHNQDEVEITNDYLKEFPNGKLLDAGCGLGDWAMYFEEHGFSVTGLDISRKVISELNERFPSKEFMVGDIRNTGMEEGYYDACYSWGVFEHFEEGPSACLKEAYRLIKPGGLLITTVPLENMRISIKSALALPKKNRGKRRFYQYRFSREEWCGKLEEAGFSIEKIKPIHKRQGVLRCLHHEFGLPYDWKLTRGLSVILAPFIPGILIGHMILAVARKPQ